MALSGIEWQLQASFKTELLQIRASKPKEERSTEEKAVVRYLKYRIDELENKKNKSKHYEG